MNGIVNCTSCSRLKENLDMVNRHDHRLSMFLLFRRPRKGACHHISRSLSDSSHHPTAGTCPLLWGPCVNKKHTVSDPDTAPGQSASCLLPKMPISPCQSASLVSFCAVISPLARFNASKDASRSTLSPPRLRSCFLCGKHSKGRNSQS